MRLKEIAEEINGYLRQFEADTKINSFRDPKRALKPYYYSGAWQAGRYVGIRYVSFQGTSHLGREEAEKYLEFLRSGGIGKHYMVDMKSKPALAEDTQP